MDHRGRFQAQGANLEESEAWAQMEPLLFIDGKEKLSNLENKISHSERIVRKKAFDDCHNFIAKASKNGGINVGVMGILKKSFPKSQRERVDLEVLKGIAFVLKDEKLGEI